jgi:hypothetical protein
MGIDDVVAEVELDVLDLALVEVLQELLFDDFGNGASSLAFRSRLQVPVHEVDLL